ARDPTVVPQQRRRPRRVPHGHLVRFSVHRRHRHLLPPRERDDEQWAKTRLRLGRAWLRAAAHRTGQTDGHLEHRRLGCAGLQARRDRHLLLPHPPRDARRIRGHELMKPLPHWRRSWPDDSEALPVDILPASNGEYVPREPTRREMQIMSLANSETERWRRKFGMSRRAFVKTAAATAIGFWAIDMLGDTRWGHYATAHNT